ncbi:MAG: regulatory signaling modulator protein AmpE [Halieaceae bacterium]|nr:regulatory signaling modulator protein AmpE [Halieaceae bacterium]
MLFLAGVIAIVLLQLWGTAERVHRDGWFDSWRERLQGAGLSGGGGLLVAVALPALLVAVGLGLIAPILFGLLWIGLAAFLLLYAFGRGDFQAMMGRYRGHAFSGDFEAAYLEAGQVFGWDEQDESPGSVPEVHVMVQRALLYEGFQRWFAVLFYFVVLGPAGAVAYRLLQLAGDEFGAQQRQRWLFYADWVPARLLAAAFSLTGDFLGSRSALLNGIKDTSQSAPELLYAVASAALHFDASTQRADQVDFDALAVSQNRELGGLLSRSAACWVVVLSLVVLLA